MASKQIKEERMREYFITAACEILKGEGTAALNVRAVAERAGYSYATIYNYFRDVKDLSFECIREFQKECLASIAPLIEKKSTPVDKIIAAHTGYISYFVQYPGVFSIFYLEKMPDYRSHCAAKNIVTDFHRKLASEEWKKMTAQKLIPEEYADELKYKIVIYTTGLMLLYLNRNDPLTYKEFLSEVNLFLKSVFCEL